MSQQPTSEIQTRDGRVFLVRTCTAQGRGTHEKSRHFQWPLEVGAEVVAPDWDPDPKIQCGQGLHGIAWGIGRWDLLSNNVDAVWMVISALVEDVVPTPGGEKHRMRAARVEWIGKWNTFFSEAWKLVEPEAKGPASSSGKFSPASSSGDFSPASSSGKFSPASSSGYSSPASSSGDLSPASSSGDFSPASSSGYSSPASSSGKFSPASSSGYSSPASSSGDFSPASSSGDLSPASSSGYLSPASSSGDFSPASSSGYSSPASSSGKFSPASSSGDLSPASSSGDFSPASSSGYSSIAACLYAGNRARCGVNGAIIIAWNDGTRPRVAVGYAGEDGIEAGVWYRTDNTGKIIRDEKANRTEASQ